MPAAVHDSMKRRPDGTSKRKGDKSWSFRANVDQDKQLWDVLEADYKTFGRRTETDILGYLIEPGLRLYLAMGPDRYDTFFKRLRNPENLKKLLDCANNIVDKGRPLE